MEKSASEELRAKNHQQMKATNADFLCVIAHTGALAWREIDDAEIANYYYQSISFSLV